jgi:hypothetical protein
MKLIFLIFSLMTSQVFSVEHYDKIVYEYTDSSVAPQYHRSYKITIEGQKLHLNINVYGKMLVETDLQITQKQVDHLQKLSKKLEKPSIKIAEGAAGTSSQNIQLYNAGTKFYDITWDSLNKVDGHTEKFAQAVKECIPNLGELLKTPLKD